MEEVVRGLHCLYGIDTGVDMEAYDRLSSLVMQASGRSIFPYKPVLGSVFSKKESSRV